MTRTTLLRRSLAHYWRGSLVVVAGVAIAVATLAGALIVGDSVRGTLRDMALARLGQTDVAVVSPSFFQTTLADRVGGDDRFRASFGAIAPIIALEGFVTVQTTNLRAGRVHVYGVDDRFWSLHQRPGVPVLDEREAHVSEALADETGAGTGTPLLVRLERPSAIPLESLHARKDDTGRTMRAIVQRVLSAEDLGDFSLVQDQRRTRAVFLSLTWLGEQLEVASRANVLVVSGHDGPAGGAPALRPLVRDALAPGDVGLTVRARAERGVLDVGSDAGLLPDAQRDAVRRAADAVGFAADPVLTYLANTIRLRDRVVPYSLVTAGTAAAPPAAAGDTPPVVLNTWLAAELRASPGDLLDVEYYVWVDPGQLVTRTAQFRVAGVRGIDDDDRHLAPVFPGITDSPTLDAWDPPFPVDLRRVRPADEAYWERYRTTPKAFVPLTAGERLWGSRYGQATSVRLTPPAGMPLEEASRVFTAALRTVWDPTEDELAIRDVRDDALAASAGVTDFGEYFVYFSFFLVVSALVLAALFFKLGVEERAREVGLLAAVGARADVIRRQFLGESAALAATGALVGTPLAVGYAWLIVSLLRTWWIGAVGTSDLALHVTGRSLAAGVVAGAGAAVVCTLLSLRALRRSTTRALLAGQMEGDGPSATPRRQRVRLMTAVAAACAAVTLMAAGVAGALSPAGAFFGAGSLMLWSGLFLAAWLFHRAPGTMLPKPGRAAVVRLGLRGASARPSRSAWATSIIAGAVFILLAVDVFRKDHVSDTGPASGVGGYAVVAESLLPIVHDLDTPAGRDAVGLAGADGIRLDAFRVRPGDDASCLNLYRPTNPRILGAPAGFIARDRFSFQASLAATEAERANPWTLLQATRDDGRVPVIVDGTSLAYVLHKRVGDVLELPHAGGTIPFVIVGALSDSMLQSELIISEDAFRRLFPEHQGYRFFLAESGVASPAEITSTLETVLASFALDALPAAERLGGFHRVENTYLATFQALGGLGLLVGTFGLAAVLLRSVVERRRELALLGAVGYRPAQIRLMLLAESASLLGGGVIIGAATALVATVPAMLERGGRPMSLAALTVVLAVVGTGLFATTVAARAAVRGPLIGALRSE